MNKKDMECAVSITLGDFVEDYDISGIVDEITMDLAPIDSIDDVPSDKYWDIVKKHEI